LLVCWAKDNMLRLMILLVIVMKEERDKEYLLHAIDQLQILEMQKMDAVLKQRKEELAREFPFKKRGFRKRVR